MSIPSYVEGPRQQIQAEAAELPSDKRIPGNFSFTLELLTLLGNFGCASLLARAFVILHVMVLRQMASSRRAHCPGQIHLGTIQQKIVPSFVSSMSLAVPL